MKFLLLILTILAVSRARADEADCSEERAEACIDNLLTAVMGDSTEQEVCRELRRSVDCLKEAVEDCLGDERDSEVDDGLEELEKLLRDNCNADDDKGDNDKDEEMEKIKKCYGRNKGYYYYECIEDGTQQVLTLAIEKDDVDENMLKCAIYGMASACYVDRVREKCGEKAASVAEEELPDIPDAIAEACNAVGETDGSHLTGENKRK